MYTLCLLPPAAPRLSPASRHTRPRWPLGRAAGGRLHPEGAKRATSVNVQLPCLRKDLRTGSNSRAIVNFPSELCRRRSGVFTEDTCLLPPGGKSKSGAPAGGPRNPRRSAGSGAPQMERSAASLPGCPGRCPRVPIARQATNRCAFSGDGRHASSPSLRKAFRRIRDSGQTHRPRPFRQPRHRRDGRHQLGCCMLAKKTSRPPPGLQILRPAQDSRLPNFTSEDAAVALCLRDLRVSRVQTSGT